METPQKKDKAIWKLLQNCPFTRNGDVKLPFHSARDWSAILLLDHRYGQPQIQQKIAGWLRPGPCHVVDRFAGLGGVGGAGGGWGVGDLGLAPPKVV